MSAICRRRHPSSQATPVRNAGERRLLIIPFWLTRDLGLEGAPLNA